jgi:DNA-binding response OmpR family regulator
MSSYDYKKRVNMTIPQVNILDATILIVDHEEANVSLLERVLRDAGHQQITSTTNPLDVCPLHRTHCYDLIVLDISTPDMDGFAVMADLKIDAVDNHLPVLVLITHPNQLPRALEVGARDFISKPFELVEVRTRIRNMLEIRLLYKKIALYNQRIEAIEAERKAELRASEARYQSLFELATDWLWEQDEHGKATKISAPVLEILSFSSMAPVREITSLPSRTPASQPM